MAASAAAAPPPPAGATTRRFSLRALLSDEGTPAVPSVPAFVTLHQGCASAASAAGSVAVAGAGAVAPDSPVAAQHDSATRGEPTPGDAHGSTSDATAAAVAGPVVFRVVVASSFAAAVQPPAAATRPWGVQQGGAASSQQAGTPHASLTTGVMGPGSASDTETDSDDDLSPARAATASAVRAREQGIATRGSSTSSAVRVATLPRFIEAFSGVAGAVRAALAAPYDSDERRAAQAACMRHHVHVAPVLLRVDDYARFREVVALCADHDGRALLMRGVARHWGAACALDDGALARRPWLYSAGVAAAAAAEHDSAASEAAATAAAAAAAGVSAGAGASVWPSTVSAFFAPAHSVRVANDALRPAAWEPRTSAAGTAVHTTGAGTLMTTTTVGECSVLLVLSVAPSRVVDVAPDVWWTGRVTAVLNSYVSLVTANAFVSTLGGGHFLCKHILDARALAEAQIDIARRLGDPGLEARCRVNLAYNDVQAGDFARAAASLAAVSHIAQESGDTELGNIVKAALIYTARTARLWGVALEADEAFAAAGIDGAAVAADGDVGGERDAVEGGDDSGDGGGSGDGSDGGASGASTRGTAAPAEAIISASASPVSASVHIGHLEGASPPPAADPLVDDFYRQRLAPRRYVAHSQVAEALHLGAVPADAGDAARTVATVPKPDDIARWVSTRLPHVGSSVASGVAARAGVGDGDGAHDGDGEVRGGGGDGDPAPTAVAVAGAAGAGAEAS